MVDGYTPSRVVSPYWPRRGPGQCPRCKGWGTFMPIKGRERIHRCPTCEGTGIADKASIAAYLLERWDG